MVRPVRLTTVAVCGDRELGLLDTPVSGFSTMTQTLRTSLVFLLIPVTAGMATGVFYSWGDPLLREEHSLTQKALLLLLLVLVGAASFLIGFHALRALTKEEP